MANKNANALTEQVLTQSNAANAASSNNANVNAHEQYVRENLSQFSGKQDDIISSSRKGFMKVRKDHNTFNGMKVDYIKGQEDKNSKEFISMPQIWASARRQRDHIRVAMQLNGEIVDTYYLGCKFIIKPNDYISENEDTLAKSITKKYSKDHKLIILGYQYNGKFVPCTTGDALQFTETREETVWTKKANEDGTFSYEKKTEVKTDDKGNSREVDVKAPVEHTMVPKITENISPNKFIAAVDAAIKENWLLLFPLKEEQVATEEESK